MTAAQQAVHGLAELAGLSQLTARRAELVIEELALNALRHGGAPEVWIEAAVGGATLHLCLEDRGVTFDPTTAPLPPAAPDRIGGNGLRLVRQVARMMRYTRLEEGVNRTEIDLPAG